MTEPESILLLLLSGAAVVQIAVMIWCLALPARTLRRGLMRLSSSSLFATAVGALAAWSARPEMRTEILCFAVAGGVLIALIPLGASD